MKSTKVLSQRVDLVSLEDVFSLVKKSIKKKKQNLFFALNINILVQLNKNGLFKKKHEQVAKVIFADGVPIIWLSVFTKNKLSERVAGTDLTEMILKEGRFKVFLLGSSNDVLGQAKNKYKAVCGVYAPPMNDVWPFKEKYKIIQKISKSGANILLVAVGPLKQEKWLVANFDQLSDCFVGIGVGSALDILVGDKPRAHKLLKDSGLEWLWRLFLEPRRLVKRYFMDFISLLKIIFLNVT